MNRLATVVTILGVVLTILLFSSSHKSAKAATALPDPAVDEKLSSQKGQAKVVLAGGCFWGLQAVFEHVKGVKHVTAGYTGGTLKNPSYEEVSSGRTGHAESIEIEFDPSKITVGMLLKVFFSVAHNPTELNRQGPDTGTQYRSAIFYENEEQQRIAQGYVDQLNAAKVFSGPIVTQILPFQTFYRAEEYHQDYAVQHPDNPYIARFDLPKIKDLQQEFPNLYH